MSYKKMDDYLKEVISEYYEEEFLSDDSMEELEISEEFKKNMDSLISRADNKKHQSRRAGIIKWAACAAVAIIVISVVVSLNTNTQAGALDYIRAIFSGGFDQYKPSSAVRNDDDITGFQLGYIPEGYELESSQKTNKFVQYVYCCNESKMIFMYCKNKSKSNNNVVIDNENGEHQYVKLEDGTRCDYYNKDDEVSGKYMIWKKGKYICRLSNDNDAECDLIKIANNIEALYE